MNSHLTDILNADGIAFEVMAKSAKVRLLRRWNSVFASLSARARNGIASANLRVDKDADDFLASQSGGTIYLLPNDECAMPSVRCSVTKIPILTELLSDTYTTCDEIIIIDEAFTWSCVLTNHGAAGVGRYASTANRKQED